MTKALKLDCLEAVLTSLDSPLSDDRDKMISSVYRLEGAKEMMAILMDWQPEHIEDNNE